MVRDLEGAGLIPAVGITPANAPEGAVTPLLEEDVARQHLTLAEQHIDRAYLSSKWVQERPTEWVVRCKPWAGRNLGRYPKRLFEWDAQAGTLRCPAEQTRPARAGR